MGGWDDEYLKPRSTFFFQRSFPLKIYCRIQKCIHKLTNIKVYDYNGIRTHNHLIGKRTLKHLVKMAK